MASKARGDAGAKRGPEARIAGGPDAHEGVGPVKGASSGGARAGGALVRAISSPGFTPPLSELGALFTLLASPDEQLSENAERALARLGVAAGVAARDRLAATAPPARARVCAVLGRVAHSTNDSTLIGALEGALDDEDGRTRRVAARALGNTGGAGAERALVGAWDVGRSIEDLRAIARALGKVGNERARARLTGSAVDDPELSRRVEEALILIDRRAGRSAPGGIVAARSARGPIDVFLHCRGGVEDILANECDQSLFPEVVGPGLVAVQLRGALRDLYELRTMTWVAFPLASEPLPPTTSDSSDSSNDGGERRDDAIGEAVVRALTSSLAERVFRTWTEGPIRYRIEWATGGHRRALTFACARAVARARPELLNDPTDSIWELVVSERHNRGKGGERVDIELRPRAVDDPRFSYRRRDVQGASHPTLAAALALVAGVEDDEVVWDPFVGSGTELVERARLGGYARMYGTDVSADALVAAKENFAAAGLQDVRLSVADALRHAPPEPVSLLLTNPPMGRRIMPGEDLSVFYEKLVGRAARLLRRGGRLVWISPLPDATIAMGERVGLRAMFRQRVDMGGFHAEIQKLVSSGRPPGRAMSVVSAPPEPDRKARPRARR